MVKEFELSNNEKEFILKGIKEGLRLDNRDKNEFRAIGIIFGPEYGRSEVILGNTRVLAKVSCEVIRPYPDRPNEGMITLSTELSPMAFPNIEPGRPSEEEVLVSRILEKAIKRSRAIDTEGLCIVANEKVWSIRVDIHFLDHDGNIIDAACIAAISALAHFRRPDVTVIGEEVTIHPIEQRNPVPLSVLHMPICITFAFFEDGKYVVVDPTLQEEQIRQGDMTMTLNVHKELCTLSKAGGIPLEMETIIDCSRIATSKATWITEQIHSALEAEAKKLKF
ncbi:14091_t:CDS:2 [Funneliformis caledonium]|uniref:Exosome complex component RRP45 n=1 Tax=Funneliformis caledonium TaxID=1117310 RepID=A0A9N9CJU9_9GLOM|nr:14091_t:CDS:2 [Funneliformis caledonium]